MTAPPSPSTRGTPAANIVDKVRVQRAMGPRDGFAADGTGEETRRGTHAVERDAGLDAHAVEHVEQIFRREISRRSRRVRTATEAACR